MNKFMKTLASGTFAAVLLTAIPSVAGATGMMRASVMLHPDVMLKQTVQINAEGHITLHGSVNSVGSDSISVKSWGGDWTVSIASDTKLQSRLGATIARTDIKVGDYVLVQGTMKANAGLSLNARQIKDQLIPDRMITIRGTVNSTSANTIMVKSVGGDWTVSIASDTKLLSNPGATITLADFKSGNEVVVRGTLRANTNFTVDATEVRNLNVPFRVVARTGIISNLSGGTFTIAYPKPNSNDKPLTVTTNANTTIRVGGSTGTTADLKNDQRVVVTGTFDSVQSSLAATKVMVVNVRMEKHNKDKDDEDKK